MVRIARVASLWSAVMIALGASQRENCDTSCIAVSSRLVTFRLASQVARQRRQPQRTSLWTPPPDCWSIGSLAHTQECAIVGMGCVQTITLFASRTHNAHGCPRLAASRLPCAPPGVPTSHYSAHTTRAWQGLDHIYTGANQTSSKSPAEPLVGGCRSRAGGCTRQGVCSS